MRPPPTYYLTTSYLLQPPMSPSANPFRSACVDALDYEPEGGGWDAIARRLRETNFRGAVIGSHGHGKTTLLLNLAEHVDLMPAMPRGSTVATSMWVQVRPDERGNLATVRRMVRGYPYLLSLDGYDLLPWRDRLRVLARRGPVLVTSHRRTMLPTVARCRTSPELLGRLIERLSPATRAALTDAAVAALYARHRGNVREALRELYDRLAAGEYDAPTPG